MGRSLWNAAVFLNSTPGVAWLHSGPVRTVADGVAVLVRSSEATYRESEQVDTGYIENGDEAYVALLAFEDDSNRLRLNTDATDDSGNTGFDSGPNLTADALANLGLAVRTDSGTVYKYPLADLSVGDMSEPYNWTNVEDEATWDAIISTLRAATTVQSLLVNITHANINWTLLEIADDPPEAPTRPTLTALSTSIEVTLTADPASDSTIH